MGTDVVMREACKENGRPHLCLQRYPALRSLASAVILATDLASLDLSPFRQHAVTLARDNAIQELRTLQQDLPALSTDEASHRRGRIHLLLRRISPGRASSIPAVCNAQGRVVTDPESMAAALRDHWRRVFDRTRVDEGLLDRWLSDESPHLRAEPKDSRLPAPDDPQWALRREDVYQAIESSPNSRPGPDGIPFLAWRRLGPLGVDIIFDALQVITISSTDHSIDDLLSQGDTDLLLNASLLVFLPKSVSGIDPAHGEYYLPEDTRPLNVVNCDNRLMANAVRFRIEPIVARWASPSQHGFLPGRSMLSNVLEVDHALMRTALFHDTGVAIFFDFKAAFPSISHHFLRRVLRAVCLPQWLLRFVDALYCGNLCQIVIGGARHPGFELLAGVRQGCPLSPLLFAVVADFLLRRLHRLFPGSVFRAYADDLSAVLPRGIRELPLLVSVFEDYAAISGLHLNMSKTVLIPLFVCHHADLSQELSRRFPLWAGINVAGAAKYLGFFLGPERADLGFRKAIAKFSERARTWGQAGGGLFLNSHAYSVYISSVLLFLLQLDDLPATWPLAEESALRALAPGPGYWFLPVDLHHLDHFGFPRSFLDVQGLSPVIKFRVASCENSANGGLAVRQRARELRNWLSSSPQVVHAGIWAHWFRASFYFKLDAALDAFAEHGHTPTSVETMIAGSHPRPLVREVALSVRRQFQKTARGLLLRPNLQAVSVRLRRKTDRWQIPQLPGVRPRRATAVLTALGQLAPPRLVAAIWRTLWNGWLTRRRMAKRCNQLHSCIFGCDYDDSIEHYGRCPHVAQFAWSRLRISRCTDPPHRLSDFLLLDLPNPDALSHLLVLKAIRTASVYRVHCAVLHSRVRRGTAAVEALPQAAQQLVRGHPGATRMLDAAWASVS